MESKCCNAPLTEKIHCWICSECSHVVKEKKWKELVELLRYYQDLRDSKKDEK